MNKYYSTKFISRYYKRFFRHEKPTERNEPKTKHRPVTTLKRFENFSVSAFRAAHVFSPPDRRMRFFPSSDLIWIANGRKLPANGEKVRKFWRARYKVQTTDAANAVARIPPAIKVSAQKRLKHTHTCSGKHCTWGWGPRWKISEAENVCRECDFSSEAYRRPRQTFTISRLLNTWGERSFENLHKSRPLNLYLEKYAGFA